MTHLYGGYSLDEIDALLVGGVSRTEAIMRALSIRVREVDFTQERSMTDTATVEAEVLPPPRPWEALPDGTYAIVELMGHTTLVGRVTELERFGAKMMGIEVLFGGTLLPVVLQGGAAIYRFTQCTPETAWKAQHGPDRIWSLPEPIRAIVPAALLPAPASTVSSVFADDDDDDEPSV